MVITATFQSGVGEWIRTIQIKTHQADYAWFPSDFKLSSTETLCDSPDTNERENCHHREKLHDSFSPNSFSFHVLHQRKKKENRKMKKRIRNRLSILRSKAGRCVSIQSSLLGFELLCFLNSSNVIFVSCVRTTFWHYCYLPVEHTVTEKEKPSRKMKIACSIAGVCKCGVPQDDIFTWWWRQTMAHGFACSYLDQNEI